MLVSGKAVAQLDVGIVVFDPGIPDDVATHSERGIFPSIRQAEARFLPVNLRRTLQDSGEWGSVRVMPESGVLAGLLVQGRILESTGRELQLDIVATDATGRIWLQREYRSQAQADDYPVPPGSDAFAPVYRELAADLLKAREQLAENTLRTIRRVALLRYAAQLAPDAFSSYFHQDEAGRYQLLRLPADGDPMLERVLRIRNQEFLFIDSVDEQYERLHHQMASTYALWLQYDFEQSLYRQDYAARAANRDKQGRRGSFTAMQQSYYAYRNYRIQEQDVTELAAGFQNETAPTLIETRGRVFRLNGTLDSQYAQWRGILRKIFALEIGQPVADD
jgi:hypothetical protein